MGGKLEGNLRAQCVKAKGAVLAVFLAACGEPPLPERAEEQSCRPFVDGVPAATLADTGCFEDVATLTPTADLVPYGVRSPLWTDGALKTRFVSLPPDATLSISGRELVLPKAAVLVKVFAVDEATDTGTARRAMEVRFLAMSAGEWQMFTYAIDDSGTNGSLQEEDVLIPLRVALPDGATDIEYLIPGSRTCPTCHSRARRVLGFTTEQLNFVYDYGSSAANQLVALKGIEMLIDDTDVSSLPHLVDPSDRTMPAEDRARSYLHANCGHCHQPDGFASSTGLALRYDVPFEATESCGVPTRFYGLVGPNRIEPGFADSSGIVRRIREEDYARMPPLGVSVMDPVGEATLVEWINGLHACPPDDSSIEGEPGASSSSQDP